MRYQTMFLAHRILVTTVDNVKKPSIPSSATVLPELPEKDAAISVSLVFVAVGVTVEVELNVSSVVECLFMSWLTWNPRR